MVMIQIQTEANHTPGPWKIDFVHSDDLAIVPVDGRFEVLARVTKKSYRSEMDAETIANAKLMAAAPQLLESVRSLLSVLTDLASLVKYSNDEISHITDAEDAVIAATLDDTRTPDEAEMETLIGF